MNTTSNTQTLVINKSLLDSEGKFFLTNYVYECREAAGRTVALFNSLYTEELGFSVFMRLDAYADCFLIFGIPEGNYVEVDNIRTAVNLLNGMFAAFQSFETEL